jgi:hypothetical protein
MAGDGASSTLALSDHSANVLRANVTIFGLPSTAT